MTEFQSQKMARYFRVSCIDGQSYSHIPLKDAPYITVEEFRRGKVVDPKTIKALFDAANAAAKEGTKAGTSVTSIPVIAQWGCFVLDGPRAVQTQSNYPQDICFLAAAVIMDLSGQLSMARDGSSPMVPRGILGPKQSVSFADVDAYDDYLRRHKWAGNAQSNPWRKFFEYGEGLLRELCANTPEDEGYKAQDRVYLSYLNGGSGALNEVISQYDRLERSAPATPCFDVFVGARPARQLEVPRPSDTMALRIAQMKGDFPLAKAQRDTLSATLVTQEGEVVALNGPPGTGKTTLLQNVVACLFTQAALDGRPAPLIWASSANNQPVTNIIQSFSESAKSNKSDYEALNRVGFMERWLPRHEQLSFGLYMASATRAETTEFLTEDTLAELLREPGLAATSSYFVDAFHQAFADDREATGLTKVNDICRFMRQRLKAIHGRLQRVEDMAQKVDAYRHEEYEGLVELGKRVEKLSENTQSLSVNHEKLEGLNQRWQEVIRSESFFETLFSGFGPFRTKRRVRLDAFVAENQILKLLSDAQKSSMAESVIPKGDWGAFLEILQERLNELEHSLMKHGQKLEMYRAQLEAWGEQAALLGLPGDASVRTVDEQLDKTWRVEAFWLAVHIFEGRWIQEIPEEFWDKRPDGKPAKWISKSPRNVALRLRFFAMLTPCFVSTFHKLPAHLNGYSGKDEAGKWLLESLWNEIDLLIVDEAGQIPPELAAGSFALAKRAIVVGDTQQIEPIWSVPEIVDKANIISAFGEGAWASMREMGRVASDGNLMRMAQFATPFQPLPKMGFGMHLNEHRRCTEPIIQYCNALCYQGFLEPKRPDSDVNREKLGLPAMGWHHISGDGEIHGGSRRNPLEAKCVADWIQAHRAHLERFYDKKIAAALGVVTPFKAQAELIRSYLKTYGATGITVGTVHALQGAERAVVIFSGVYTTRDDTKRYFFDRSPNMLNVAVSRAKDSFLVFGDTEIYRGNEGLPSGLLGNYLNLGSPDYEVSMAPNPPAALQHEESGVMKA